MAGRPDAAVGTRAGRSSDRSRHRMSETADAARATRGHGRPER
jgi:hypothetical protein